MRIVVTGGAGYLGSVLVPKLLRRHHEVVVVDVGYFGLEHLRAARRPVEARREDIRGVAADAGRLDGLLRDVDCIIHLAAISNDPSAELAPELTRQVNFEATVSLAAAAKARGIHFVFSSSCSVYGSGASILDENSAVDPLTTYAVSKVLAEEALLAMSAESWRPAILRNGTLFGYSPRMRFDLVVNIFSLHSTLRDEVSIFGDGSHWRPFLHVDDCARAFVHAAENGGSVGGIYNVANENLRVVDLIDVFAGLNPRLKVRFADKVDVDQRNYRVSTERISLTGFTPRSSVAMGAEQLIEAIVGGTIPDPESTFYQNAKWLKELSQIGGAEHRDIASLMDTMARMRALEPR